MSDTPDYSLDHDFDPSTPDTARQLTERQLGDIREAVKTVDANSRMNQWVNRFSTKEVRDLLDHIDALDAEIARLREHSVLLNQIAWKVSVALGRVGENETMVFSEAGVVADFDQLMSRFGIHDG